MDVWRIDVWRSSGHVETNIELVTGAVWTLEDEQIILEPTSLSSTASLDTTLTTGTPLLYHTTPPKMVSRLSVDRPQPQGRPQ